MKDAYGSENRDARVQLGCGGIVRDPVAETEHCGVVAVVALQAGQHSGESRNQNGGSIDDRLDRTLLV